MADKITLHKAPDGVDVIHIPYRGYQISVRLDGRRPETVVFEDNGDGSLVFETYSADGDAIQVCLTFINCNGE